MIEGAGLGLFIYTARLTLYTGTAVGKYWGNSTRNGGIPSEFAPRGARTPEGTRDNGAYLLRHMDYLVDADEDCSMGYANEGWDEAISFFQHSIDVEPDLLLVLKRTLHPEGVYEITGNYGRGYWLDRLASLSTEGHRRFLQHYGT